MDLRFSIFPLISLVFCTMCSTGESALISRKRKQLEARISKLRFENNSLLKSLTNLSAMYNEIVAENKVLEADVAVLTKKVKTAEETVKRIDELNPSFQAMSVSPSDTPMDVAVPVQDDPKQHFSAAPSSGRIRGEASSGHGKQRGGE